jgi:mannose-6-phosphate isomerase-like protein (cupin superfamily)
MSIAAIAGTPVVDEISQRDPDSVTAGGSRTWSVCGRNFVVAITELEAGDRLTESDLPEEYLLLVQDDAVVGVEHDGQAPVSVSEPALVVVPAGTSTVRAAAATTVARVFTARCEEQMRPAVNHAAGADPRAAPLPDPAKAAHTGSDGIRIHRLRDISDEEGRLGRIFRTSSLMVNWFPVHEGPRDTERLSPHSHEDFEQMSVTLVGDYAHHLRVPWTPRMSEWRDDEHVQVTSPSLTLIPPTVVHTTRAVGTGPHTLIDVFAPPREDFLANGWVLNAGEYQGAQA